MFFCLLLAIAGPALASTACSPPADAIPSSVRYVIDGDTVVLSDGTHVRLIGLNAPEIGHEGKPDQPFARAARKLLQTRLKAAKDKVLLASGPQAHGPYGRELAHLYTPDGADLSSVLLRRGLASLIAIPPDITRLGCYRAAEADARHSARGLWKESSPLIFDAAQIQSERAGFAIVRGTVTSVRQFHAGARLELDHQLWLWVPHHDLAAFGTDPAHYRGRKILARGWLHPYHGHPEMVIHRAAVLSPAD